MRVATMGNQHDASMSAFAPGFFLLYEMHALSSRMNSTGIHVHVQLSFNTLFMQLFPDRFDLIYVCFFVRLSLDS